MLNQKGMGLAEVMVAVGITSISMMGIVSSQKLMTQGQRTNVQIEEADNLALAISNLLTEPTTCGLTFGPASAGGPMTLSDTADLTRDIVDFTGMLVFDANPPTAPGMGAGKVVLRSYRFIDMGTIGPTAIPGQMQHAGRLLLNIERQGEGFGGLIARNITMRAIVTAPGGIIQSCHSMGINRSPWAIDGNNIYNINPGNVGVGTANPAAGFHTAVPVYMQDIVGVGAMPVAGTALNVVGNSNFAGDMDVTGASTFNGNMSVTGSLTAGSISTPLLNVTDLTVSNSLTVGGASTFTGAMQVNNSVTATQFCIGGDCRTTFAVQTCPPGQALIQQNANGTVSCATPQSLIGPTATCSDGYYLAGYLPGGAPNCRALPNGSCGVGQYIYTIDPVSGNVTCRPVPPDVQVASCGAGQSLIGVSGGVPQCAYTRPTSQTCPAGQSITGFDAAGNATCSSAAIASQGCPSGQLLQGFDAAGAPICTTAGGGTMAPLKLSTMAGRTTIPVDGAVQNLNLGDVPATADGYFINWAYGSYGLGRSDRNCVYSSTSGSYDTVYSGTDSKGDGGQRYMGGTIFVPADPCGTVQVSCNNNGSQGYIRITAYADDGMPNACTAAWVSQACGYVYPIGDPCTFMSPCGGETAGASCTSVGAQCSQGATYLRCERN